MEKRTLLFLILVGITFVGFNLYLGHEQDKKNQQIFSQKNSERLREQQLAREEALQKIEPLESLPVVPLSTDPEGTQVIAYGVNVDGSILSLSWKQPLPTAVYTEGKSLSLMTKDSVVGGPAIYAPPSFSFLNLAALPDTGSFDVQLLTFPSNGGRPQVTYGRYQNGSLEIPFGPLRSNAIALYNTERGYLPLGFYDHQGDLFIELQNLPLISPFSHTFVSPETISQEQQYYVLENEYMQLVFSNVGGALTEINLPFQSNSHPKSVVKEIEFDRDIVSQSPANAHFPLHPFFMAGSKEATMGQLGGYYPLLRRDQVGKKGFSLPAEMYALNLVSDYPEMAGLRYEVKEFSKDKIVFQATQANRKITKTFTLPSGPEAPPYIFDLALKIEGDTRGLWLTSGVPEVEIMSNSSSPLVQYRVTRKGKIDVQKLDLPKPREIVNISSFSPDWVVNSNGYLGTILDPLSTISGGFKAVAFTGEAVPTRLSLIDLPYQPYPSSKYPGYEVQLPIPLRASDLKLRVFAGPFEEDTLKMVDKLYSDPETGYNPHYISSRTFYGWFSFISEPFAKLLFQVMKFFYFLTHSWGLSIILLTVFLRILLYPLNAWSIKSMRRMQKLSPQITAIQQKHKKDPKKAQMEIMQLYREKKVNPFMGCLPILIQIPFLIAMFDLLKSSFQLRGASFIPGWINDLTAPDVLFQWQKPIFFIGNQFHLLPILLGVVMFFQQRMSSQAPKDPKEMTDQQRQQKAMGTIMTVIFTVMFYHFPSGLNIYWLSSMLLGMVQQWFMNRYYDEKKEKPVKKEKHLKKHS